MVQAVVVGDAPLSIEALVALESNDERIRYWASLREILSSNRTQNELIASLVDIQVPVPGQEKPMRYIDIPGVDDVQIRARAKCLSQIDPDILEFHAEGRIQEFIDDIDFDVELSRISCPVLLLQANPTLGGIMSDSDVETAARIFPDLHHVFLENVGHDLGLASWKVSALLRTVTNFLESV